MRTPPVEFSVRQERTKPWVRCWPGLVLLTLLWSWPAMVLAFAMASSADETPVFSGGAAADMLDAQAAWAQQRERLLDVLARDTERALAELQPAPPQVVQPAAQAQALPDGSVGHGLAPERGAARLRLRGLYGIEPRFTVLLEVDGVIKLYRPGASLPINGEGAEHEFRLLRVQDRCVVLRWGTARPRTACYHNPPILPLPVGEPSWAEGLKAPLPDFSHP